MLRVFMWRLMPGRISISWIWPTYPMCNKGIIAVMFTLRLGYKTCFNKLRIMAVSYDCNGKRNVFYWLPLHSSCVSLPTQEHTSAFLSEHHCLRSGRVATRLKKERDWIRQKSVISKVNCEACNSKVRVYAWSLWNKPGNLANYLYFSVWEHFDATLKFLLS